MSATIGPDVDALADVATIQFLHDRLGTEFPVSGDDIARHLSGAAPERVAS